MATSSNNITSRARQANGSAVTDTSTRNNRGVIATGSTITNSLFVRVHPANIVSGVAPQTTEPVDHNQTNKAINGGTFAFNGGSGIIARVTTSLAGSGIARDFARSAGNEPSQIQSIYQKAVGASAGYYASYKNAKFDILNGVFVSGSFPSGVQEAFTFNSGVTSTNSGSTDEAANPTRLIPGEFVYALGTGSGFVYANYPAKNGG